MSIETQTEKRGIIAGLIWRGKRVPSNREREGEEGEDEDNADLVMLSPAQKKRRTDRGRGGVTGKEVGSILEAAGEDQGGELAEVAVEGVEAAEEKVVGGEERQCANTGSSLDLQDGASLPLVENTP